MNAAFVGLAFLAALNPKLLVVDLILARNRRPRAMFVCFLLGGIVLGIAVRLLGANHLHVHRRQRQPSPQQKPLSRLERWTLGALHEPRYGLAVLIGAAVGAPGASYLIALHHLVVSKTPAATAVVAVLVFVTISWAPVFVPFAFLIARPQRTEKAIKQSTDWITSHERQIAATVALVAGAYMVISGTLRFVS